MVSYKDQQGSNSVGSFVQGQAFVKLLKVQRSWIREYKYYLCEDEKNSHGVCEISPSSLRCVN